MNEKMRHGALALAAAAIVAAPSCARSNPPLTAAGTQAVSVDVESLWDKEAASDPITAYRVRLSSEPDNPALHNNLGNLYVLRNRMDEAIEEFKTAARLDRTSAVPWNNLGTVYKKIGKVLPAKDAFQKALSIDPSYALVYYNLGTLYDEAGDYDNAMANYLKAISLRPDLADVKVNPQAVNNKYLDLVKLRHYLEETGNIALPLDRLPE